MSKFGDRLKHAWNAFMKDDSGETPPYNYGVSYSIKPDRTILTRGADRSLINTVCNRIALDAASIDIKHVKLDEQGRYLETIDSTLNNCLAVEANIDQTGRELVRDIVMSMLDEGCVAVVPVVADVSPKNGLAFQIFEMRTGKIIQWYPKHVRVRLYDELTAKKREIIMPKSAVAIIENPFYSIMNSQNSTAQRLKRKLALLDSTDEQNASKKLNMIVQLPYALKGEGRRELAKERVKDIEKQLVDSPYGIAYSDSTEKIIQLNRSLDNNLQATIEYLTNQYLSQLGITMEILNGTANSDAMNNYYTRVIEPIMTSITEEFIRKFLTKTARSQRQSIKFFRDPFKLVPVDKMADLADKFTRNAILTSNEVRQIVGLRPSKDPSADELRNKNISEAKDEEHVDINGNPINPSAGQNGVENEEPAKQYTIEEIKSMSPQEKLDLIRNTAQELMSEGLDEEDQQTVSLLTKMSEETVSGLSDEEILEIVNGLLQAK